MCPGVDRSTAELRPVVAHDGGRSASALNQALEDSGDVVPSEATSSLTGEAFATEVVDHVQHSKSPTIGKRIGHEVHRPTLVDAFRHRQNGAYTAITPSSTPLSQR